MYIYIAPKTRVWSKKNTFCSPQLLSQTPQLISK